MLDHPVNVLVQQRLSHPVHDHAVQVGHLINDPPETFVGHVSALPIPVGMVAMTAPEIASYGRLYMRHARFDKDMGKIGVFRQFLAKPPANVPDNMTRVSS